VRVEMLSVSRGRHHGRRSNLTGRGRGEGRRGRGGQEYRRRRDTSLLAKADKEVTDEFGMAWDDLREEGRNEGMMRKVEVVAEKMTDQYVLFLFGSQFCSI